MITLETFRTHRHSPRNIVDDPDVLVIRRGYRVRLHGDHNAQPWEIWRSINIARLHALDYQSTQRVFSPGTAPYCFTVFRPGQRIHGSRHGRARRSSTFVLFLRCDTVKQSSPVLRLSVEAGRHAQSCTSAALKQNLPLRPLSVSPSTSNLAMLSLPYAWRRMLSRISTDSS